MTKSFDMETLEFHANQFGYQKLGSSFVRDNAVITIKGDVVMVSQIPQSRVVDILDILARHETWYSDKI